ncbi:MAG TPA: hypothetical protein PLW44_10985 [Chitinophagales bacterium]|nr:hypothetical protein [Chitinophagales bacterium]
MIVYKFYIQNLPSKKGKLYLVNIDPPKEHLQYIFEGNETESDITELIDSVEKVKSGEFKDYSFGNQSGFEAVAIAPNSDDTEYPDGAVFIYNFFEGEQPLFNVSLDEMIELLTDYRKFLSKIIV